jgi:tetratricopeptide (TPR) repeat protein
MDALNRAQELGDDSAEVYWMFGRVHMQQNDLAAAESAFRQALEVAPDDWKSHSDLGFTLYQLGEDLEGALSEANAALALDPDSASEYATQALVYYDQGDVQAALSAAKRAVELDAEMVPALYVMGACYRDKGQLSQAAECFQSAIEHAGPWRFQQLYASRAQEALSALEQ